MTATHHRLKSREELVEDLIAELDLSDDRREDLKIAIERDERIISTSRSIAHVRSSEQLRAYLKKYYKVLRKVRALTDGLGVRDRSLVFGGLPAAVTANSGRFLAEVDRLIDAAEFYLTNPLADSRDKRWDALKYASVLRAKFLVEEFSQGTLSQAGGVLTARVAAILYELVTARPVADISEYLAPEHEYFDRVA